MLAVEVLRCVELVAWEEMMPGWNRSFGERMRGMGRWLVGKDAGATAGADSKTSGEAKTGVGAKSPPPPPQDDFERHSGSARGSQPESLRAPAPRDARASQQGGRSVPDTAVSASEARALNIPSDQKPPLEGVGADPVKGTAGLGEQVVEGALELKGKLEWTMPAYNQEGCDNDFFEFVKNSEPLGEKSRMNCWEAVIYSAVQGKVFDPERLAGIFEDIYSDMDYDETIRSLLNVDERQPADTHPPQAGDIILMYGMAHVALSLGGDRVLSLWDGPNGLHCLQETTIEALQKKVESSGPLHRNCMKTALKDIGSDVVGEQEREEFEESLSAYQSKYDEWEDAWVEAARSVDADKPELGMGLSAKEFGEKLERKDPDRALLWDKAVKELGWGGEDDQSNTSSRLLLKAMEFEDPERFSELVELRVDYEKKFARFQGRIAVVDVIPQSKVWGEMQKQAALAAPSSAWKSKFQINKLKKQAVEAAAAVQKNRQLDHAKHKRAIQDKLKARKALGEKSE